MPNELDNASILAAFGVDALPTVRPGRFDAWTQLAAVVTPIVVARNVRVLGIEGSQGSGKSTLSATLVDALADQGVRASTLSLDDFYLAREDRLRLSRQVHPLLQTRGVPGTHDWQRLDRVMRAHEKREKLTVPRFDKGLDDRIDDAEVECDCLILEGWCVGITPQSSELLAEPTNDLERDEDQDGRWRAWVNQQIEHYLPIWSHIKFWVQLRVPSFEQVYQWRAQQERDLPAAQRMSDAQLSRFIQHYERLTRHLWTLPPRGPGLSVELDASHNLAQVVAHRG